MDHPPPTSPPESIPQPAAAVALSGWVYLAGSSPSLERQAGIDLLVTRAAGLFSAEIALGDGDPTNPLLSPLYGNFAGVTTPVYLQVGGAEGLVGENLMITEVLARSGVPVRFEAFPEMQHIFQQGAGLVPEADDALGRVGAVLRPLVGL